MDKLEKKLTREWYRAKKKWHKKRILYEITINNWFGIELRWTEKVALKHYMDSFVKQGMEETIPPTEGCLSFLYDYFELSVRELGHGDEHVLGKNGKYHEQPGMELLGTPGFKEYCRDRVQIWRDERELI